MSHKPRAQQALNSSGTWVSAGMAITGLRPPIVVYVDTPEAAGVVWKRDDEWRWCELRVYLEPVRDEGNHEPRAQIRYYQGDGDMYYINIPDGPLVDTAKHFVILSGPGHRVYDRELTKGIDYLVEDGTQRVDFRFPIELGQYLAVGFCYRREG